jgi:CRP-like cAMP-binding protein
MQSFNNYLKNQTGLTDDMIQTISNLAEHRTLRRNEPLLQAGDVCRHKVFIVNGLLRAYSTSPNGNEHILQFSPENSWTLDVESYDKETPSLVNIEAIEQSDVLLWKKNDFNKLLADFTLLKQFSEQLIARNIYQSRQRIMTNLSATPEEKYKDFIHNFPEYLNRLPLRMIASYLGISLKTLTRIRHTQLHR